MTLREWVASREPPVPRGFREWMTPVDADREATGGALADEAAAAMSRAVQGEGRPRRGAFDLLVADGFLTWACEVALGSEDPEAVLDELIRRFAP